MATSADRATRGIPVQHFIDGLRKLKEDDFTGVNGTLHYLRENSVNSESLEPYLFWNANPCSGTLIDKTELDELLPICWEVGMGSSIHNHQGQNCWMAAPIGRLAVQNFRLISEDLAAHRC